MKPVFTAYEDLYDSHQAVDAVISMLEDVENHDGVAALGEAFVRGVTHNEEHRHVLAVDGDGLADSPDPAAEAGAHVVGVLAITPGNVAEVAVHPSRRHSGIAIDLFNTAAEDLDLTGAIDVWAHGDLAPAQSFVKALNARRTRELLKMAVDIPRSSTKRQEWLDKGEDGARKIANSGFELLTFPQAQEKYGAEHADEEWVRANNEAFAWHPEQGGWDVDKLHNARETDWFDPEGVIMMWDEAEDRCVGFHWTKMPVAQQEKSEGEREGEVYVVCLADAARGKGLGGPITMVGIEHLLRNGAGQIVLYVEGDNAPAIATYSRLGFDVVHTDVVYRGTIDKKIAERQGN